LRTALAAANVNQAKEWLDGPRQSFTIGANDQLDSSAQYNQHRGGLQEWRAGQALDIASAVIAPKREASRLMNTTRRWW